jgi:hypothetical protein
MMQLRSFLSSRRGRLIVAVAVVLFSVMAHRQYSQMDRRFFQLSGPGMKGLVF